MVIDTLGSPSQNDGSHQSHEPVVYFYCNRDEPQRRDPTAIMQALLKQMSTVFSGLPKPVVEVYDNRLKVGLASGSLSFKESHSLLVSLLEIFPQTTIIIDALDESDPVERWQLLETLAAITHSTSLVKIFISSRDDVDIKLTLEKVPNLYIDAQDNGEDIKRFIHREMTVSIKNRRLSYLPVEMKQRIVSTLVEKANGM